MKIRDMSNKLKLNFLQTSSEELLQKESEYHIKNNPTMPLSSSFAFKAVTCHVQPGWAVQKLSTKHPDKSSQSSMHAASNHPGSGPEVHQGQLEADSELARSPVFPKEGCLLCLLSVWCACLWSVAAASRAEIVYHVFPPIWTWFKQSGKWTRRSEWAVQCNSCQWWQKGKRWGGAPGVNEKIVKLIRNMKGPAGSQPATAT